MMHAQQPMTAIHATRWSDGKISRVRWEAWILGRAKDTNDNVLESHGQREQGKDERERGSAWTGLSLISSVLTYIMHRDASAY